MTKAEEIFNVKAYYNKWLKELTYDEKDLVLEMINEAREDAYNQALDWFFELWEENVLRQGLTVERKHSTWEEELEGKNIHSVLTWCKDCGMKGCNIPFDDECGNCGSKNTVRYYDKETIDLLF